MSLPAPDCAEVAGPTRFFVDDGALMIVESTIVPPRTCRPRAARCALIVESFNGRLRDEFLAVEQFDRRDPEMHQTRKGRQWFFGMKLHTGTDARTGLVHSLSTTAANVSGVNRGASPVARR